MKLIPFLVIPPKKNIINDILALVISILVLGSSLFLAKYIHKGFVILVVLPFPFILAYALKNFITLHKIVTNLYYSYGPYYDLLKVLRENGYEYYDIDHDNILIESYDLIFGYGQEKASRIGLSLKVIFSHQNGNQIGLGRYRSMRHEYITKNDIYFLLKEKPSSQNGDLPFISGFYVEVMDGQDILNNPRVLKDMLDSK